MFIIFTGDPPFLIACVVAICGGVGFMVSCRFVGCRWSICSPFKHCLQFAGFFFVFPMSDERFEVVVHHRGEFAENEWCKYVGGEITHWSCDPDRWSYFEILGSLQEMGYHSIKGLCYCVEMLLHPLNDDRGALNMLHIARHYGEVHMFVVHGVDEAQVEDNIVELEGDAGRPIESGGSSHVVSEFEVLGTKIVV